MQRFVPYTHLTINKLHYEDESNMLSLNDSLSLNLCSTFLFLYLISTTNIYLTRCYYALYMFDRNYMKKQVK